MNENSEISRVGAAWISFATLSAIVGFLVWMACELLLKLQTYIQIPLSVSIGIGAGIILARLSAVQQMFKKFMDLIRVI